MPRAYDADTFEQEKERLLQEISSLNWVRSGKAPLRHAVAFQHKREELGRQVARASQEVLEDREVALAVVGENGRLLEHFGEDLRNDLEVAAAAVDSAGLALKFVGPALQDDKSLLLRALRKSPSAIRWASEALRGDREVVLETVGQDGWTLQHAAPELRSDREVVLKAVQQYGWAVRFAGDDLRSCKDIIMAAVQTIALEHRQLPNSRVPQAKLDTLKTVESNGSGLRFASDELRRDKGFVMEVVEVDWSIAVDISAELRGDVEVMLKAVRQCGCVLGLASEELRSNTELVLEAVKECGQAMHYADKGLKADKDFALLAARGCRDLKEARACYDQVDASLQQDLPWETFWEVHQSLLAVPGQTAPVLTVRLSKTENPVGTAIRCEANLLSGSSLVLEMPISGADLDRSRLEMPSSETDPGLERLDLCRLGMPNLEADPGTGTGTGTGRGATAAIANDLARALLEALWQRQEAVEAKCVFINIAKDDGEFVSVTAWDWQRHLGDFVQL